jgi:hypothetical protein
METPMFESFLLGVVWGLSGVLVAAMLAFGPRILETIEGD